MDSGRSQQGLRGPPKALINLSSGDIICLWRPFADPVYPQYWTVTALGRYQLHLSEAGTEAHSCQGTESQGAGVLGEGEHSRWGPRPEPP